MFLHLFLTKSNKNMVEKKVSSPEILLISGLETRWQNLCHQSTLSPETFSTIKNHYSEPHRRYHNLSHLDQCFTEFDSIKDKLQDPLSVELALWFHDFFYDPTKKDNEEKSAQFALDTLQQSGLSIDTTLNVHRLILSTKHINPSDDSDEKYLNDIDMSILGQSSLVFDSFDQKIEQEFTSVYSLQAYLAGRIKFFQSVLSRGDIFFTDFFKDKYQSVAIKNLTAKSVELENRLNNL